MLLLNCQCRYFLRSALSRGMFLGASEYFLKSAVSCVALFVIIADVQGCYSFVVC